MDLSDSILAPPFQFPICSLYYQQHISKQKEHHVKNSSACFRGKEAAPAFALKT